MNTFLSAAEAYRHILVYFHDNDLGGLAYSSHMGSVRSEVEETVLVHRGNLEYSYVRLILRFSVISWKLRITDRSIVAEALRDRFSLDTAHMPGVPCHMFSRVLDLEDLRYPH